MCSLHTHCPVSGKQLEMVEMCSWIFIKLLHYIFIYIYLYNIIWFKSWFLLIIQSPAHVTVTWSAAIHIITETPVLRLKAKIELLSNTGCIWLLFHICLILWFIPSMIQGNWLRRSYQTLVAVSSGDKTFAITASCLCITGTSCWERAQRITAARCGHKHKNERKRQTQHSLLTNRKCFKVLRDSSDKSDLCMFTDADIPVGHHWGRNVPFYSGHSVLLQH